MRIRFLAAMAMVMSATVASAQEVSFVEYGGCKAEDFVVIEQDNVTIEFQGSSYEPACIKIKPGTTVVLPAAKKHPLQASVDFNEVVNPFRSADGEFLENQTRQIDVAGFYGYYCTRHADPETGNGMGGMIWVVE
jgi:plastocyanin